VKIAIYFCKCGTNVSEKIDPSLVQMELSRDTGYDDIRIVDFLCGEEGKAFLEEDIKKNRPDRLVIAACSPRDHEETFRRVMEKAGMNPFLMQLVNVREQIAWVTADPAEAVKKTVTMLKAAIQRVKLHEALEKKTLEVVSHALVIGAGPAGLKAALGLAEAGRKVTLIEKTPVLGGLPVRYEEVFPNLECGTCMLEPLLNEVLHGKYSEKIEILTQSQLVDVAGFFGNFIVKIRKSARFVDPQLCIGCTACFEPCPASGRNSFNCDMDEKKAIGFAFTGNLPNAPYIDQSICLRSKGEDCRFCEAACPVPGAILLDDRDAILECNVGAIVLATGAGLYDASLLLNLGYGKIPDVVTSLEMERILSATGPTQGKLVIRSGKIPAKIAIVHCVGSLEADHKEYCSGICCQSAFKFNQIIARKLPGTKILHFFKEMVSAGKREFQLSKQARNNPDAEFFRYEMLKDLQVSAQGDLKIIKGKCIDGGRREADMIVLCPAVVPSAANEPLRNLLELSADRQGFFEELHERVDSGRSKIRGMYFSGSCLSPTDIRGAMSQGMAATGHILSEMPEGKKIEIEPITAGVDADRCSGCRSCITVCPYKAITFNSEKNVAEINSVLCMGCGTCVSTCPSGSIAGKHFSDAHIFAEIEGVLS